jgi:hypothetical protein
MTDHRCADEAFHDLAVEVHERLADDRVHRPSLMLTERILAAGFDIGLRKKPKERK